MTPHEIRNTLYNSKTLNTRLRDLTEQELGQLLTYERTHEARMTVMLRLFGRFNLLRAQRERANIVAAANSERRMD